MKTTLCNILLLCIMCVAGTACTHNHGEINGWFGTWAIDDAGTTDYDGTEVPRTLFLQFQSSVVCLRYTDVLHDGGESYGTWSEENGMMRIDFNGNFDVTGLFPQRTTLEVVSHEGNKAQLRFSTLDNVVNYYLTRQP